jgi:WD40 repeat protein
VAFSPDGKTIAAGSRDGTVKLWDVLSGQVVQTIRGYVANARSVAFSPDGNLLACGSWQGAVKTAKVWDVTRGQELASFVCESEVAAVAFSPDGKTLASGCWGSVMLWDLATKKELANINTVSGAIRPANGVAFSPDGQTLAAVLDSGTMQLWDLATGLKRFTVSGGTSTSAAFSPDGATVASGGWDQLVTLWDPDTGKERTRLKGHRDIVASVAFSPDGKTLASGSHDRSVILWDLATGRQRIFGHMAAIRSVSFSPDGMSLASGSDDGSVKIWDLTTGHDPVGSLPTLAEAGMAFSPDDRTLATSSSDGTTRLWDVGTGTLRHSWQGGRPKALAFSADATTLASLGSENDDLAVGLWDVATGANRGMLEGRKLDADRLGGIRTLAFSADGGTLAVGSHDGTVTLWDLATRLPRSTFRAYEYGWVTIVAFSPDGKTFATGSNEAKVTLWDAATGRVRAIGQHAQPVYTLAYSLDSATLASGSLDGSVKLWDAATGQERMSINAHAGTIRQVVCLADGKTVAARTSDGTVKLWDIFTGQERGTLKHPMDSLGSGMAFSHDGKILATAGADLNVRLWRAATELEVLAQSSVFDFREEAAFNHEFDGHRLYGRPRDQEYAYRQGLTLFEKLLARFPKEDAYAREMAIVLVQLGSVLAATGRIPEAEKFFRRAIELEPKTAVGWQFRGEAQAGLRRWKEALADYQKALELAPQGFDGIDALSRLLSTCPDPKFRDPVRAAELAKRGVEIAPKNASSWDTLGVARYRTNDWKASLEALDTSSTLRRGGDSRNGFFRSMVYWQLGNKDEARRWYDRAVGWMDNDQMQNEELQRFRSEAEELLMINK